MISSGSPISVRHMVSICFSPPDSTPAAVSARSLQAGEHVEHLRRRSTGPGRFMPLMPSIRFCRTVIVGKMSRFSGT